MGSSTKVRGVREIAAVENGLHKKRNPAAAGFSVRLLSERVLF